MASSRESSASQGPAPYRVLMLGAPAVGKSSLVSQFMTSEYLHAYDTSIGESRHKIHGLPCPRSQRTADRSRTRHAILRRGRKSRKSRLNESERKQAAYVASLSGIKCDAIISPGWTRKNRACGTEWSRHAIFPDPRTFFLFHPFIRERYQIRLECRYSFTSDLSFKNLHTKTSCKK